MIPKYVQEDFGFHPIGLKEVDRVGNFPVFSSPSLKDRYKKAIGKQNVLSPILGKINYLVDEGLIIPCFANKGIFSYIKHTLTGTPADKGIGAFYSPRTNKVYILFDNRLKLGTWTDNEALSLVTIHELMHYVAKNYKKTFYDIFKEDLVNYYDAFYKDFAGATLTKKELLLTTAGNLRMFEWEKDVNERTIETFRKYMYKVIKSQNKDKKELVIDYPLDLATVYWHNPNRYIQKIRSERMANNMFFALHRAYKTVFGIKTDSMTIQEILFPSEVVAISSEKPKDTHYRAVKFIR
jgi:hypothetical protein